MKKWEYLTTWLALVPSLDDLCKSIRISPFFNFNFNSINQLGVQLGRSCEKLFLQSPFVIVIVFVFVFVGIQHGVVVQNILPIDLCINLTSSWKPMCVM